MNIQEFMELVAPDGDHFFVLEIPLKGAKKHFHAPTISRLATVASIKAMTCTESNIYYAMASFKKERYADTSGKLRQRTQENAEKLKCFWVDLDCKGRNDGTDYPDQAAALAAIDTFCIASGIKKPTLTINSGYGLHVYWILNESIASDVWTQAATRFKNTLDAHGVLHDASCTTDCARVLRPVGSHNRKASAESREVTVIGNVGERVSLEDFLAPLVTTSPPPADSLPFEGSILYSAADMQLNEIASNAVEYPPSSTVEILKDCGLLRAVYEVGGNVQEPLWHKVLGVVKHTTDCETAIHDFSRGHKEYSYELTVEKAAAWNAGPTSCEVLQRDSAPAMRRICKTCKHKGVITSPIQLGQPKVLMVETVKTVQDGLEVDTTLEVPALPIGMQRRFKWLDGKLSKNVPVKGSKAGDADALFEFVVFCDFFFYPYCFYRDSQDMLVMVWKLRERAGSWRDFELTGAAMGCGGTALFKELGEQGVLASHGQKMSMESYITAWFSEVKRDTLGVETYMHFGWHGDSFLLGDSLIKPDGVVDKVRVGGDAERMVGKFNPKGTLACWRDLIDETYNKPGQEQYQFILGSGFGAPLVHLMDFHGGLTVSALSFGSGQGKTTAEHMAMGIFGDGKSDNSSSLSISTQQATPKFVFAHAGLMHNLPIVVDEITNIKPQDASEMLYTFSGGTPRMGLRTDGRMSRTRFGWATILLTSSNKPLTNIIAAYKPGSDAEIARMMEFTFRDVSPHSKEKADMLFRKLYNNYGYAGRAYMAYVVENQDAVRSRLVAVQKMVDDRCHLRRKDRYWSVGITVSITGLMIARDLGLISFDMSQLLEWIMSQVDEFRCDILRATSDPSELASHMLAELWQGILVTDTYSSGKGCKKPVYIIREPRGAITGRAVTDDRAVYISQAAMVKWSVERHVSFRDIIAASIKEGWVKSAVPERLYMGSGTDITAGQCRCFKFSMDAMESSAATYSAIDNIISMMSKQGT